MTTMEAITARPDHVPEELVYDFDMYFDEGLLREPHGRMAEILRDAPPIFWTPRNGGYWVVARYDEVYAASRDTETFSSVLNSPEELAWLRANLPEEIKHFPLPTPINLDPPLHSIFRGPLQKTFSPKAMMARREDIRNLANVLIDKVIDQGHCDFIPDIAEPLPVQVFLKMMGLPLERLGEFRDLVHEFLSAPTGPFDSVLRMRKIADAMKAEFEARRDDPKDDIISLLWNTEIDGKPMTFELMEDFGVLLFIAGLDTVINGMGFGMRHLASHPEIQDQLRQNPALIVEAAEELLRRYAFVNPTRRVARDTELAGVTMREGDSLRLMLPSANLDAEAFENPEAFELKRENNVHVAFGVGPHRCLGSHLARIELQVIYEQMLARLPAFRIDDTLPVKFHCGSILAIDSLPLRWD